MKHSEMLNILEQIVRESGDILKRYYGNLSVVQEKADASLVTEADTSSERHIIDSILKHFPDSRIVSEEEGVTNRGKHKYEWFVDPLDGTNNFVRQMPLFCVSIGMAMEGELQLGIIYAPILGQLFTATKGGGAYYNGNLIQVAETSRMDHAVVGISRFFSEEYQQHLQFSELARTFVEVRAVRSLGSAALEMAYVARGNFDLYLSKGIKSWDSAAGQILVEEAGGSVRQFDGSEHSPGAPSCLACNQNILSQILARLVEV